MEENAVSSRPGQTGAPRGQCAGLNVQRGAQARPKPWRSILFRALKDQLNPCPQSRRRCVA
eukprot:3964552-Pyramimonas_sp.AAC.1